jgi:hypothetical protein
MSDAFQSTLLGYTRAKEEMQARGGPKPMGPPGREEQTRAMMQRRYEDLKKMPETEQRRTHRNVLLVLDDVVSSVKKAEFDPRLA